DALLERLLLAGEQALHHRADTFELAGVAARSDRREDRRDLVLHVFRVPLHEVVELVLVGAVRADRLGLGRVFLRLDLVDATGLRRDRRAELLARLADAGLGLVLHGRG